MTTVSSVQNQQHVPQQSTVPSQKTETFSVWTSNPQGEGQVEESLTPKEVKKSKIDELLEKLCKELAKYGLKPEDLKANNLVEKISGFNEEQLEKIDERKLNTIYDCVKTAIIDSAVNGKVDLEKATKLGIDYHTALIGGWDSIEQFQRAKSKNKEGISERIERFFGLKPGSFSNLSQDKIEHYLERYINGFFIEKIKNGNNPEQVYKLQMQDFTKLLINTPDSQKGVFRAAIVNLAASNRCKGIKAVLASFETQAARTQWADGCDNKFKKEIATKPDFEGNVPNTDDVTESVSSITAQQSEDAIKRDQEELQQEAEDFFGKNKDALLEIARKEAAKEALSEEEQKLVLIRDNYFRAVKAGEISGTVINQVINDTVRAEILTKMNNDAWELQKTSGVKIYNQIIDDVAKYMQNNKTNLPISEDIVKEVLDKATNGNYAEVVKNGLDKAAIIAPDAVREEYSSQSKSGIGFEVSTQQPDTSIPAMLRAQLPTEENTDRYYVEPSSSHLQVQTTSVATNPQSREACSLSFDTKGMDWISNYNTTGAKSIAEVIRHNFNNFTSTEKVQLYEMAKEQTIKDVASYGLAFLRGFVSYNMLSAKEKEELAKAGVSGIVLSTLKTVNK